MNRAWGVIWGVSLMTAGAALAGAQNSGSAQNPPQQQQGQSQAQTQQQSHPRRVRARVEGFDLAPETASANQIGGASRGVDNATVLYAPHKGRVYTLKPSFWWQGTANASYRFHLQDVSGQFGWDRQVTGTSLDYPADAPPLEPGKTYLWRVYPDSSLLGPPPPAAMIVVIPESERTALEAAVNDVPGTGLDAEMARAQLYYDHRLWYDAVMAYSALISKYPGQSQPYRMRGSLYDQLPVTQALADKDFAHAD